MRRRGFTLIELLAAIAVFSVLAAMLFQMLKGGLDVWTTGEGQREAVEKASAVLDTVAWELRMQAAPHHIPGGAPVARLLVDWHAYDLDADGRDETQVQWLRFVRALPEERTDPSLRAAGDLPGATEVSTDLARDLEAGARRAPAGLAEILYAAVAEPRKGRDPARLSLVRAFRAPPGGSGSLFEDPSLDDPACLLDLGAVVVDGVLHFGVELEGHDGRWTTVWDSTRGTLLDEVGANRFLLAAGPSSLEHPEDDVFPRRVRLVLVLERDEDAAQRIRLLEPLGKQTQRLRVDSTRAVAAPGRGRGGGSVLVKVGGEWMRVLEKGTGWLRVERGVLGSAPSDHPAGASVHLGRRFERTLRLPVARRPAEQGR